MALSDRIVVMNRGVINKLDITERDRRRPEIGDRILVNVPGQSVHLFAADEDGRALCGERPMESAAAAEAVRA